MDNHHQLLVQKSFVGLEKKFLADKQEYIDRLNYELGVIEKLGFSVYFLVMEDIVRFVDSREDLLMGPGRGSGAGSLCCYCLRITKVDPIKYGLYFERFLSEIRISPPDIDSDINDRDAVIEYLEGKYGKDRVARVGSLNFLRTKSCIRDIGRALDIDQKEIDNLAKLVPKAIAGLWDSFDKECEREPKLLEPEYAHIMEPVKRLWGVTRSYGTHAGGVAIAPGPINRFVPLYKNNDGFPVSQFDWRDLEKVGLIKFDILGLSTLRIIQKTIKYASWKGHSIDIELIPLDDKKTYELICSGNTDGVFQLGSDGIKKLTMAISPQTIEDLALVISLYRPGPISSGLVENAVQVRNGTVKAEYIHPTLEPILAETYSVIVYQESVMRIAREICGYSGPTSDELRKCIAKKLKDKMELEEPRFIEGAQKTSGYTLEEATKLWTTIQDYAQYLFNKSHGLIYALISYQTAYLKAHHPVEFYSALLAEENDPDEVLRYVNSAKEHGIELLGPDINLSGIDFQPEPGIDAIRTGLSNIKGMPRAGAEEIIRIRDQ